MNDEIDLREIFDRILRFHKTERRRYPADFESLLRGRQKEYNVAKHVVDALLEEYTDLKLGDDPNAAPDLTARDTEGNLVAIEVTELVDQETVERYQRRGDDPPQAVYRVWERDEVIAKISERLRSKDGKDFKGGPYRKKIVIVFTAEPEIDSRTYGQLLSDHDFGEYSQIDEAHLLFRYEAESERCPPVQLGVRRNRPS